MKKIYLILALALGYCVNAHAWNKAGDAGILTLATKHLNSEAAALVKKHVGESCLDDVQYITLLETKKKAKHTKEIHFLHLDANLQPMKVEGDDVLKAINNNLKVLANHSKHADGKVKWALRNLIELMCDLHNFSNVRIEGIAHSQADFKINCYSGDVGKRKVASPVKWSRFWAIYPTWHTGFSPEFWAEDMELCLGAKREEFSKGTPAEWATEIGKKAAELYGYITPDCEMTRRVRNELEDLNFEMMTRAGYRLAALLNQAIK